MLPIVPNRITISTIRHCTYSKPDSVSFDAAPFVTGTVFRPAIGSTQFCKKGNKHDSIGL